MKIKIIKCGSPAHPEIKCLTEVYMKRIKSFCTINSLILKEKGKASQPLEHIADDDFLILLDERGRKLSSLQFSKVLSSWLMMPCKNLTFLIGGPYGVEKNVRDRANDVLCVSDLTMTSDLAWLVICEQLYRAFTIIKGMTYHHE